MKQNKKGAKGKKAKYSSGKSSRYVLKQSSSFYLREAYKALRTNTSFSLTDKEGCKIITVTSSLQREGKSMTALNLAISLGQADHKVLIMDCDLRRPKVSRLLNCSAPAGVSNVLMNPSFLEVALLHDEEHGIDVMLAGDIPPNPSELLASPKMAKLLEDLREIYDYIILDTPPVAVVTDAVILAPLSDGVLFVVRAGQTERIAVMHAMEQLEYAKAKVLGFVLNAIDSKDGTNPYNKYRYSKYMRYGHYGYGYGYGSRGYGYGYGYGYGSRPRPMPNQDQQSSENEGR